MEEWDGSALFLTAELISEGGGTKKLHILRLAEHEPGLPWQLNGKESACNTGDGGPIPPWGHKESDTTEQLTLSEQEPG